MIYRAEQVSACFPDGSCLAIEASDRIDDFRDNHPTAARRYLRGPLCVVAALMALGAVIFFARLHTYDEPLERDITTYAVIAHELLAGKKLYSQLWDHKPPAIHATYAAAETIAGYGRNSILLLNVGAGLATLIACYAAGSALTGKSSTGLFAAVVWAMISGELGLEANQPNTEVFINAFMTAGFALVLRKPTIVARPNIAILAGLFFAVASLYKQVVIVPVALLCLAHLATSDRTYRKTAIADVMYITTAGALLWAVVFGYFTWTGRGDAFIDANFIYNRAYAGHFLSNLRHGFFRPPLPLRTLMLLGGLAVLTFSGLLFAMSRGPRRPWILLLALIGGCHIAALLGQFFAHYYQLWLPPLAIGTAWSVSLLMRQTAVVNWRIVRSTLPLAILAAILIAELPYYFLPPKVWSARKYGSIFIETDVEARKLAGLLRPGETFYEWGNETGLYFATKQDPPSGVCFVDPLLVGPLQAELWDRVAADLQRSKPDVVILESETVLRTPASHPILRWIRANYRAISRDGVFLVVARKGSRVEREHAIASGPPPA